MRPARRGAGKDAGRSSARGTVRATSAPPVSRGGWGLIGILLALLIVCWLYMKQSGVLLKPMIGKSGASPRTIPQAARDDLFHLTAVQAQNAVQLQESMDSPRPSTWEEFGKLGVDVAQKDPWGGRYYIRDGWLRCTGNPKAAEKIW